MEHLTLPRTDLRVSSLCLGCADFGAGIAQNEVEALLDRFAEQGGNFLDTAAIYADWTPAGKGSSERSISQWLRAHPNAEMVIATKGAAPEMHSPGISRTTRSEIEFDLNQSLANLGVETVDLWYLHRDDPSVPVEEVLGLLEDQKRAGKLRFYAASNWRASRLKEAEAAAQKMGATGFVADQPMWSLAVPDLTGSDATLVAMNPELLSWHEQSGVAAIPYSSQANGFFQKVAEGRSTSTALVAYESELVRATNHARFSRLEAMSGESGLSLTQLVLGFLRGYPFPVVPIIGSRTMEQLNDSLSGADVRLSPEQVQMLEAI
jgi:aryl-alcohol dehydrogenase-like predicted oxidoreductase